MASQLKEEAETSSCVDIQFSDEEPVKHNHNMKVKTERIPTLSTVPNGYIANPNGDLAVVKKRVSLVKSVSKTAKLEAEVLEKDETLEQLRSEMVEMEQAMGKLESDNRSLEIRLSQSRQVEMNNHRFVLSEKLKFKKEIERREEEKRSLLASLHQRESESAAMSQRLAQGELRLQEELKKNLELEQKLDQEVKHREAIYRNVSEAKSLSDALGRKIAETQTKSEPAVNRVLYMLKILPDGSKVVVHHPRFSIAAQPVTPRQATRLQVQQIQTDSVRSANSPEAKRPRVMTPQQDLLREQ